MAEFWVYENLTHGYARVHRRSCCMCNNGRGVHADGSGPSGRWHAADTREQALVLAQQLGQPAIADCAICAS
ncbi:hypothetical protein EV667_0556 [Ancylobacter aquaticus]|uniref:Uncharacterized protein n=1 Tax=Ancylobacter aquaticus TaxID=100 RepID=A0A4V2PJZ5_ANCAQ|nr:hypothetical protein [Ancylobacter aquaticus]TCK30466.1 hypothetical protein EV667_0556 [Ancylobacter aquaticus]